MKSIQWKNTVALLGVISLVLPVQAYASKSAQDNYLDVINSEAKSIQRNAIRVKMDESILTRGVDHRLNVQDMLEKLKRLTTHGVQQAK